MTDIGLNRQVNRQFFILVISITLAAFLTGCSGCFHRHKHMSEEMSHLLRGDEYMRIKKYDYAIKEYKKVLELNPKSTSAYNNMGSSYINGGDSASAIAPLKKSLEVDPKFLGGHLNLVIAYTNTKDCLNAGKIYRKLNNYEGKSFADLVAPFMKQSCPTQFEYEEKRWKKRHRHMPTKR